MVLHFGRTVGLVFGLLAFTIPVQAQDDPNLIAPTEAISPSEQIKMFHLPPGFAIELIASEPDIGQPTNIGFDSAGQLWISSTLEYPYPAKENPRDAIRVMRDTNGDGVPDAIRVFADGLNIPIGLAKVKEGLLAYSIPNISLFRDTNGDGVADERNVAYSEFGFRDTHGMASSFRPWIDGWVYACHGFTNDSSVKGADGQAVQMNSGNTYRLRSDGSHIEQWTWGQVNPFGLAFDPMGNLYSADCHSKPAYMLLRCGYYPSFGKPHDGLGFAPELIGHLHGSTGISGIVYYAAKQFPEEYEDNLFIGNPVTGRVNRDRLERHGSTYRAIEMADFISCDDRWFRPVDLTLAPDGSLYIADFYNCIIGHYEVRLDHPRRDREHGRIWRVYYKGTPEEPAKAPQRMEDLTKLDAIGLLGKLADPNLTVRVLATNELVDRVGRPCLAEMRFTPVINAESQAHALWVVERLTGLSILSIRRYAEDPAPIVRVHLIKALAERTEWPSDDSIRKLVTEHLLSDTDAFVRRAAADALGRHPDRSSIAPLVKAWNKAPSDDTHLIHVIRIALRDNLRAVGDIRALAKELEGAKEEVQALADISLGLPTAPSAEYLLDCFQNGGCERSRRVEVCQHTARYLPEDRLAELFRAGRKVAAKDDWAAAEILRAFFQGTLARGMAFPPDVAQWGVEVALRFLANSDPSVAKAGIEMARDLHLAGALDRLKQILGADSTVQELRLPAIEALYTIDPGGSIAVLAAIVKDPKEGPEVRKRTAEFLGKTRDPVAVATLVELLKVAPADLAVGLSRGLSWSDAGGEALLKTIEEGRASAELLNDSVVSHELKFRAVADKDRRINELKKSIPNPDETLRKLIAERQAGFQSVNADAERGKAIFLKNCANCHQIAGQGAKIGPQLDGVGVRGLDRLLEDTLDPDRNVDQAFRRIALLLADGSVVTGLILRNEGAAIVIADAQGKEVRVPMDQVEERQESKLSPMPNDIAKSLSPEDFHDLMAYLLSQRQ